MRVKGEGGGLVPSGAKAGAAHPSSFPGPVALCPQFGDLLVSRWLLEFDIFKTKGK